MRSACLAVFVVALVFGSPEAGATNPCGPWFSSLGRAADLQLAQKLSAFGSRARVHVAGRLRDLAEKQNKDLKKYYAVRPYGDIEPIPAELRPKDPQIAAIAERANALLQSEKDILDFVETMAKRAAEPVVRREGENFNPDRMLKSLELRSPMIEKMAREQGWGEIIGVNEILDHDQFRVEVLGTRQLHFDFETDGGRHAVSAHALQWLMLTPKLEAEFGKGAARRLHEYLASPEGYRIWMTSFDRGPAYYRDLRGPYTFMLSGITGNLSFLGVR